MDSLRLMTSISFSFFLFSASFASSSPILLRLRRAGEMSRLSVSLKMTVSLLPDGSWASPSVSAPA